MVSPVRTNPTRRYNAHLDSSLARDVTLGSALVPHAGLRGWVRLHLVPIVPIVCS